MPSRDDPNSHRVKVEAKLGCKLTNTQWQIVLARAWSPAHADSAELAVEDLCVEAKTVLGEKGARSTRVDEKEESDPRFDALARIFERKASEHPAVTRWRRRYLSADGDRLPRLLKAGEVDDFVCSQFGRDIQAGDGVSVARTGPPIGWRSPAGECGRIARTEHGGLAELGKAADELTSSVRWPLEEAVYYVLTGVAPPRVFRIYAEVLIGDSMATSSIRLDVDPRTPGEAVKVMYEHAQRQAAPVKDRAPMRSHPVSERGAALALFLEERPPDSWRNLLVVWNESHAHWAFESVPNFAREGRRAREAVIGPFSDEVRS